VFDRREAANMSGSTRSEAAAPAAISRRDAIMGALALAAG
jgi:hypothetical protein